MALCPGDRVYHPNKKDWGIGKVLSVTPERINVFFVMAGNKQLSPTFVRLEIVDAETAKHPLLDNLTATSQHSESNFLSLPEAIQKFLTAFPGGFEGKRFHSEERDYKVAAHQLCCQLLDEPELKRLIADGKHSEVCERARRVEAKTNLLASFEKIKFNDALKHPQNQTLFATALADILYGSEDEECRFLKFAQALEQMGISKWPLATFFGYIRFPEQKIFIKPEVTQKAAALCCWEINYLTEPNWRTYNSVLGLFEFIRCELISANMPPRDMIDVQSFIWCSAQY